MKNELEVTIVLTILSGLLGLCLALVSTFWIQDFNLRHFAATAFTNSICLFLFLNFAVRFAGDTE